MTDTLQFLQIQAIQLRKLLEDSADDPILRPQLEERLEDVEVEIRAAEAIPGELLPQESLSFPRAAIFLRGGGVLGNQGIRPALAGESLIQYEKMFTEQALHDERIWARTTGRQRRPRGASMPGLLFTGTPRGSFGLEFSPQPLGDPIVLRTHINSLQNVADALISIGTSDSTSLEERIQKIPARVLKPLKQFLNVLSHYGAELRLAFSDIPAKSLSVEQIKSASTLLERQLVEEEIDVTGVFRGMTHETGHFDLMSDEHGLITGFVADELTEDDLDRIGRLTNQRCMARLLKTKVQQVSGEAKPSYVLINALGPSGSLKVE